MERFDDEIPERSFDNFQFLSFTELLLRHRDPQQRAMQFALDALMELPEQYKLIKQAGMLSRSPDPNVAFPYRMKGQHKFQSSYVPGVLSHEHIQLSASGAEGSSSEGVRAHTSAPGGAPQR